MTDGLDPDVAAGVAHLFDATWAQVLRGEVVGAPSAPRFDDPSIAVDDEQITTCRIRWYRPAGDAVGAAPRAALVWAHGGGWQYGGLDMPEAHNVAQRVARDADMVVVSVDYRLAPSHRHPAGRDDIVAAFGHVASRASDLGVDPRRIAVGGASAGAHLAALAAVELVAGGTPPAAQFLAYPAVDPVAGRYEPWDPRCPEVLWLDRETVTGIFSVYVPDTIEGPVAATDPALVPAAARLVGLPPTLVTTAAVDGLTAQAEDHVSALAAAGVDVVHHRAAGMLHGYLDLVGGVPAADRSLERHIEWLQQVLGPRA